MLGGGIITVGHAEAWDHVSLTAGFDAWHHVAMIYDGAALHFLEVIEPEAASKTSNLVSVNNLLFIGQAGTGTSSECFVGLIDEIKVFAQAISYDDVAVECGCAVTNSTSGR